MSEKALLLYLKDCGHKVEKIIFDRYTAAEVTSKENTESYGDYFVYV